MDFGRLRSTLFCSHGNSCPDCSGIPFRPNQLDVQDAILAGGVALKGNYIAVIDTYDKVGPAVVIQIGNRQSLGVPWYQQTAASRFNHVERSVTIARQ